MVPDSGTGELAGLRGRMAIDIVDGAHFYAFDYELPDPRPAGTDGTGGRQRRGAYNSRSTTKAAAMTQMMRALVKREAAKGIWMEEVPVPAPGPNEVLIKLEKTAICGTDLHIYLWDEWSQRTIKPGLVIGHEFVGRIVELGPGVTGYKVGQRVSAEGHIVCGHCRNCRAGRQHLCPNTVGIGVNRDGAFAEFIVMPASNLWPIPDQIPSELAAFFDPYGNAAHLRAGVRRGRRGRADHRRRADRHHRRRHLQSTSARATWSSPTSTTTASSSPPTWARRAWSTCPTPR